MIIVGCSPFDGKAKQLDSKLGEDKPDSQLQLYRLDGSKQRGTFV
jgi:hypothetical protein